MSDLKPFVGGNWKCNGTKASAEQLINVLNGAKFEHEVDVVVCPTFLHLDFTLSKLTNDSIAVAGQNAYPKQGAFTGEVSVDQLADAGVKWVVLGHSERRQIFKESDELIASKVAAALAAGLSVIACIGETLEEREADKTLEICTQQFKAFAESAGADWSRVVLAYEPVWAIGTGRTATPEQAQEVHTSLRKWASENISADVAANLRIIYGGSVTDANAQQLYAQPDINGFLVGGASLKPAFLDIVKATASRTAVTAEA